MAALRSHSAGRGKRTIAPPSSVRQRSTPGTEDEKRELSNVCFEEGDLVTFIFTHRYFGWVLGGAAGVHLGMQVVLKPGTADQQIITVGFYPKKTGGGMVNPVEGALFIPDPAVRDSLAGKIAYTQLNDEPFKLSASAAGKLNKYTCTKEPGKKIEWSIKKAKDDGGGGGASKTSNVSFQRVVTSPDFSYKFHTVFGATCPGATNCQGFITRIFDSDLEILKAIVPFLHARGSPEVAYVQARMQAEEEEARRRAEREGTFSDGTMRTRASMGIAAGMGMGMGGNKKKKRKKTRRRKRKRKKRRKTRRRRGRKTRRKRI